MKLTFIFPVHNGGDPPLQHIVSVLHRSNVLISGVIVLPVGDRVLETIPKISLGAKDAFVYLR